MTVKDKTIMVRVKGHGKSVLLTVIKNPEDYYIVRAPGVKYPLIYKKSDCDIVENPFDIEEK